MKMPDRAVVTYHASNFWKDNPRWVVRDGPAPLHDPPGGCCEMCGCDACTLTWIPSDQLPARFVGSPGEWLCQRCDPTVPDRTVRETSGQRVRRARELRKRSLRHVAADAGVSPSTLSRWENGKGEPMFSHVARVAQVLNISLDWLAGEVGHA